MGEITRSPMLIRIMLACYYSPDPEDEIGLGSWTSEVGQDVRTWLAENGLIDDYNRATDRGKAWVDFICQTPLPIATWVLPDRKDGKRPEFWENYVIDFGDIKRRIEEERSDDTGSPQAEQQPDTKGTE